VSIEIGANESHAACFRLYLAGSSEQRINLKNYDGRMELCFVTSVRAA
jgi:hypothetical protein